MSRPSSANAARRPSSHGNPYTTVGTTPMYSYTNMSNDHKGSSSGISSGGKTHNRPSSAGHTRPTGGSLGQSIQSRINAVNAMAAAADQPPIYTPYPGGTSTQNTAAHFAMYTGSNTGSANTTTRPKSAGAVRPSGTSTTGPNIAVPVQVGMSNNNGNGLFSNNPATLQQIHQQQYNLQQQRLATHFGYGSTNYPTSSQHQPPQHSTNSNTSAKTPINPSSSNPAAVIGTKTIPLNTGVSATVTDPNQQWNNAYKMHYGYSSGTGSTNTSVGVGKPASSSSHTMTPPIPVVTSTTKTTATTATAPSSSSSSSSSVASVVQPIVANKPILTMPIIASSSSSASSPSSASASLSNRPISASATTHISGSNPTPTSVLTHTAAEAAAIGMRATIRPASASATTTRLRTAIETSHKYISETGVAIGK